MKKSRRERKAYNQGRIDGYQEGYAEGLHDGNPFFIAADAIQKAISPLADVLSKIDPVSKQKELSGGEERW